jgi:hypothetical protein
MSRGAIGNEERGARVIDRALEQTGGRIRLATGPFLWWSFAILALTGEMALWMAIHRQARGFPAELRLAWLIGYTPRTVFLAFVLASLLTVVVDVLVKMVLDLPMRRWLAPRNDREDDAYHGFGFHLGPTERVLDEVPARLLARPRSSPGTLVLTDRRVWFFPSAWDAEPWSLPRDQVRSATVVPPSGFLSKLLRGLPPQIHLDPGPLAGPRTEFERYADPDSCSDPRVRFVLAEPRRVRSWFGAQPFGVSRRV